MYFHCSKEEFKENSYLEPRVPLNKMNSEDNCTKRVCVSKSIDGCLCAIGGFKVGDKINVYEAKGFKRVVSPTSRQVQDVIFTGEEWVLDRVQLLKQYTIEITDVYIRKHNTMSIDLYSYKFI